MTNNRILKLIIVVLLILGFCLLGIRVLYDRMTYKSVINTTIRIKTSVSEGSGVILDINDEDIIIVTACHVTESWDGDSRVIFNDGTSVLGQIFSSDEVHDLSFISVDISLLTEELKSTLVSSSLSESIKDSEYAFTINTFDGSNEVYKGQVKSSSTYLYDLDMIMTTVSLNRSACEGMSGMGVFNKNKELLGLIIAGNDDGLVVISNTDNIRDSLRGIIY